MEEECLKSGVEVCEENFDCVIYKMRVLGGIAKHSKKFCGKFEIFGLKALKELNLNNPGMNPGEYKTTTTLSAVQGAEVNLDKKDIFAAV